MSCFLGLDTSNYTTSAALYDTETGQMIQAKRLLPVREGERGLRQSDALFHHVRQLPDILEALYAGEELPVDGIAASDRPREAEGSYMPCFLAGSGAARQLGTALHRPVRFFTHQQGHVAAALFGAGCTEWAGTPFLAFHVSGGTTDALLVRPDRERLLTCETVGGSLDLKAGQLIDRVGVMLGLSFPAGPALEALAAGADGVKEPRAVLRGSDCHLSGVENQCRTMLDKGVPPAEIARFCLLSVLAAIDGMTAALRRTYGPLPLLYAGGVMANRLLRAELEKRHGGRFAPPEYSADNAAGIAWLGAMTA